MREIARRSLIAFCLMLAAAGCGEPTGTEGPDGGDAGQVAASCVEVGEPITIFSVEDMTMESVNPAAIVTNGETTQVLVVHCRTGMPCQLFARTLSADPTNPVGALSPPAQTSFSNGTFSDAVMTDSAVKIWVYSSIGNFDPLSPGGIDELSFDIGADGHVTAMPPGTTSVPLPPSCTGDIWNLRATGDQNGGTHLAASCDHPVLGTVLLWVSDPSVSGYWIAVGDPQAGWEAPKFLAEYRFLGGNHVVFGVNFEDPLMGAFYIGSNEVALATAHPFHLTDERHTAFVLLASRSETDGMFVTGIHYGPDVSPAALYSGVYGPADLALLTRVPAAGLTHRVDLPDDDKAYYFYETKMGSDGTAITLSTDEASTASELWYWSASGELLVRHPLPQHPVKIGALGDDYLVAWAEQGNVMGQRIDCRH
jgi:hypothetical protein